MRIAVEIEVPDHVDPLALTLAHVGLGGNPHVSGSIAPHAEDDRDGLAAYVVRYEIHSDPAAVFGE